MNRQNAVGNQTHHFLQHPEMTLYSHKRARIQKKHKCISYINGSKKPLIDQMTFA